MMRPVAGALPQLEGVAGLEGEGGGEGGGGGGAGVRPPEPFTLQTEIHDITILWIFLLGGGNITWRVYKTVQY